MTSDERTILVAGGAGYVGSVLVRRLLSAGYRVRVIDMLLYGNGGALAGVLEEDRFSFLRGDIRSGRDLDAALEGVTDVILLASLVGDPVCKRNPDLARSVNVDGAWNLVERSRERGIGRFVFASTCSNYGLRPDGSPASETDELHPLSLYAESKVEMEGRILDGAGSGGMTPTVMRVSTAYGISPRMRFDLTISEFTRQLALGRELDVFDADTWRPYCHVDDISDAMITVLEAPAESVGAEVFNLGGDDGNYTKRMIVEAALEALDGEGTVTWTEGGMDARNYRVSFEKIARELGWRPSRTVPGAIRNLLGAVRSGVFADVEQRELFYGNYPLVADESGGEGGGGGDAG
ncbi:MAG: NAD-dependent epimerase/dehydratase family protein [Solirubrobacterales bacterium]